MLSLQAGASSCLITQWMCASSSKQFAPTRMSGRPDSRRPRLRMGDPGNLLVRARSWYNAFILLPWWFSKTRACRLGKVCRQASLRGRNHQKDSTDSGIKTVVRLEKDSCKRTTSYRTGSIFALSSPRANGEDLSQKIHSIVLKKSFLLSELVSVGEAAAAEITPVDHYHKYFTSRDIILVKFIQHAKLERRDRIAYIQSCESSV